jgi:hypothetical protein
MAFNINKCMVMHFGTRNKQHQYYMEGEKEIHSNPLPNVPREIYKSIPLHIHQPLQQYVFPHREFTIHSWSPGLAKDKEVLLAKVQKRAIKMVFFWSA